jgi:hypothetical protein
MQDVCYAGHPAEAELYSSRDRATNGAKRLPTYSTVLTLHGPGIKIYNVCERMQQMCCNETNEMFSGGKMTAW